VQSTPTLLRDTHPSSEFGTLEKKFVLFLDGVKVPSHQVSIAHAPTFQKAEPAIEFERLLTKNLERLTRLAQRKDTSK